VLLGREVQVRDVGHVRGRGERPERRSSGEPIAPLRRPGTRPSPERRDAGIRRRQPSLPSTRGAARIGA
jgi:hypothetical protein